MNDIAQYREKPLSIEDYRKLEVLAGRFMTVKEKTVRVSVPVADAEGNVYRWDTAYMPDGMSVTFSGNPDPRVMESIMRPATSKAIAFNLARLCQHKPYARGPEGFQVVVSDMLLDLEGCSEWAVIKTCEHFRLNRDIRFFPDTADFVDAARKLDKTIREAYAKRGAEKQLTAPVPQEMPRPTFRQRRRIARMCKLAGKPKGAWTKWEIKFFNAIGGKSA